MHYKYTHVKWITCNSVYEIDLVLICDIVFIIVGISTSTKP